MMEKLTFTAVAAASIATGTTARTVSNADEGDRVGVVDGIKAGDPIDHRRVEAKCDVAPLKARIDERSGEVEHLTKDFAIRTEFDQIHFDKGFTDARLQLGASLASDPDRAVPVSPSGSGPAYVRRNIMHRFGPRLIVLPAVALLLQGCAADIMSGYIGRTPEQVMARYGPPENVFDLPDGRRAYQWLEISSSTSPGSEETRTRWLKRHNGRPPERVTTTQVSPPMREDHRCFYTMYARYEGQSWVFDDFERPELGC